MRLIKVLLTFIIITILFIFSLFHIFINMKGRFLLVDKLNSIFHKEVFVGSVRTKLLFGLVIKDLEVKDLFKIDEVFVSGGMFDIWRRNFILAKLGIKKATIYIEKTPKVESRDKIQSTALSQEHLPDKDISKNIPLDNLKITSSQGGAFQLPNIILKQFVISDSVLNFTDHCSKDKVIKITIKDLNVEIKNLELPLRTSKIIYFELTGKIPWQNHIGEGKIWFAGWVNFFKKDIRAELKINDIDGIYLCPYYSKWVDLEKSRIQKAELNFFSEIYGLNNDVTVDCHLELSRIEFKPRSEDQPLEKAERIATAVIDMFKAINKGKIALNFKFKTKMDNPEFGLNNIIKMAVEEKISQARKEESFKSEEILEIPAKLIKGTVSTASGLTKSVINGTVAVGRELKKRLEEAFTKEESKVPLNSVKPDKQDSDSATK